MNSLGLSEVLLARMSMVTLLLVTHLLLLMVSVRRKEFKNFAWYRCGYSLLSFIVGNDLVFSP